MTFRRVLAISALAAGAAVLCAAPALAQMPVNTPSVIVQPAAPSGGVINIGQALGPLLQPYVDAIVQALIVTLAGWVVWILKSKLGINVDAGHRDALVAAAQRQASSLVADGFVKIEQGGKISVDNAALANAANAMLSAVPDAAKHFQIDDPQKMAGRIVDALPQVPAVAQAQAASIVKPT